jgi:hypothetical protein
MVRSLACRRYQYYSHGSLIIHARLLPLETLSSSQRLSLSMIYDALHSLSLFHLYLISSLLCFAPSLFVCLLYLSFISTILSLLYFASSVCLVSIIDPTTYHVYILSQIHSFFIVVYVRRYGWENILFNCCFGIKEH